VLLTFAGASSLVGSGEANTAGTSSFPTLDRHALSAPPHAEQSLDQLVAYLVRPARNDLEKTRTLFRWMTDRISYDVDSFFAGQFGELRPEGVLRRRRAVCSGYTALFEAMARRAGVEAVSINGYAKGIGHESGRFHRPNHAWNAVKLEGEWRLLDVTWAAGHINSERFVKKFGEHYFLTPPAQMVLTHLPSDPRWQLLSRPLTLAQFEALPRVHAELFSMGVSPDAVWDQIASKRVGNFVRVYNHSGPVRLVSGPLQGQLRRGADYYFAVEAPAAAQLALVNNGRWVFLQRNGSRFEGAVRPDAGDLKLVMQRLPSDRIFQTVLSYGVNAW
jgi:hypothetical protein